MELLTHEQAECVMTKYWEFFNKEENKHLNVKDVNISPFNDKYVVRVLEKEVNELENLDEFCRRKDIEYNISSCQ